MRPPIEVGPIRPDELPAAVRIFLAAFHDNVRLVYGEQPRPDAMLDVWTFAQQTEPAGFLAARTAAGIVGYAFFTSSVKQLQRNALRRGKPLVWALGALSGRYGVRWGQLARLLWNKALFVGGSGRFRTSGDAQLLNIAVDEKARGGGVAKALVRAGMEHLAARGVSEVRLEVRPDNAPAIKVYRDAGFVEQGRSRDIHGDWLVMTAQPERSTQP
ncbi:MAG: GNAT family N-acetyltransferase [Candidatus Eremiobacteraeota bacterium]|nr:GNAT family N-acetyltransferase [Candidatus Eremiobacteraeota bacterium]